MNCIFHFKNGQSINIFGMNNYKCSIAHMKYVDTINPDYELSPRQMLFDRFLILFGI